MRQIKSKLICRRCALCVVDVRCVWRKPICELYRIDIAWQRMQRALQMTIFIQTHPKQRKLQTVEKSRK